MTTHADIAVVEQAVAPDVRSRMSVRLAPLDALRGLIIVVMALDHANAFIAHQHPPPELWSAPPPPPVSTLAFLTRFVTHFAAPGFFFLMGAGMALLVDSRRRLGWSEGAVARYLLVRGGLLIVLQLLVENPAWRIGAGPIFTPQVFLSYFGVLYGLGAAMIVGTFLLRLHPLALIGLGLVAEVATELVIGIARSSGEAASLPLLLLLIPVRGQDLSVYYPLIPWLGVALFGMAFGCWLMRSPARAYRNAAFAGAALLVLFTILRLAGGFGNLQPPAGPSWVAFLNLIKYPPSIVFLALTLGVDLLPLALLARAGDGLRRWGQPLLVFGRSPLFFYIAHLYLYGLIGLALGARGTGVVRMYPFWLLGLAMLYPLCWLYGRFKHERALESVWRLF